MPERVYLFQQASILIRPHQNRQTVATFGTAWKAGRVCRSWWRRGVMLPGPTAFRSSRVTLISPLPTEVVRTGAPIQQSRTELPGYWLTGEERNCYQPVGVLIG